MFKGFTSSENLLTEYSRHLQCVFLCLALLQGAQKRSNFYRATLIVSDHVIISQDIDFYELIFFIHDKYLIFKFFFAFSFTLFLSRSSSFVFITCNVLFCFITCNVLQYKIFQRVNVSIILETKIRTPLDVGSVSSLLVLNR